MLLGIAAGSLVYKLLYFLHIASMREYPTPFTIAECAETLIIALAAIVLFQFAAAINGTLSKDAEASG